MTTMVCDRLALTQLILTTALRGRPWYYSPPDLKKRRYREVKYLSPSHTASEQESWELHPWLHAAWGASSLPSALRHTGRQLPARDPTSQG